MGYTIERRKFTKFHGTVSEQGLAQALMADLSEATHGFDMLFPASLGSNATVAVFESNAATDPLAESGEKWRIRIEASEQAISINIGTDIQIPADGSAVSKTGQYTTSGHLIGLKSTGGGSQEIAFLNKDYFYKDEDPESGPLSYRLSISDHGVAFCVWKDAADDLGTMFAWFVAQRPVDPADGAVLTTHYAPVFCVYSCGGGGSTGSNINNNGIRKFVVRETDVLAPTESVSAVVASEDSTPIINPMSQVSISVDNKYMITFPSGLNTPKRAYKHELDMIAYTSSDVIAQDSDVSVTVFGEAEPRTYKALNANSKFNTGMRIMMLTQGGGIAGV